MSEDTREREIFQPEAKTIVKIFGDIGSYYKIPDYQRPYSWEDEQIEQLWDDLYSAMESGIKSYFLGPIILIGANGDYFEVVDGQQRLTTLTILFCVIRDFYEKMLDDKLKKRIMDVVKSSIDEKYRLRLITQSNYQSEFEKGILDHVNFPQEITKKKRAENKFLNTALILKEKLDNIWSSYRWFSHFQVGDLDIANFKEEYKNNNEYAVISEVLKKYGINFNTVSSITEEKLIEIFNELISIPNFLKLIEENKGLSDASIEESTTDELISKNKQKLVEIYPLILMKNPIKEFTEYILNKVEMITITCSDQSYAIKLFQVLNTRGLDLTPADLIKSYLYSKFPNDKNKDVLKAEWIKIEEQSKQTEESITDLLTYYEYYLLAQNPKRSLYEELTNKFNGQDPKIFIYEFKKFVDAFNEIYKMDSREVFPLWYLPNQIFWKAILTTAKRVEFNNFDGLCRELRKMYYSYWIADYTTSKVKYLSFSLIEWLKGKKKLDEIKDKIDKKMTEDKVPQRMVDNLQDAVYGKPWLKPLLAVIEYQRTDDSKDSFIELDNKLHADHILPEKWYEKEEWKEMWSEDQAKEWLNKIGNLTLLSGKKNIAQHNDPPKEKAKMYKEKHGGTTAFKISQDIISTLEKGIWTEEEVEARQSSLILEIKGILEVEESKVSQNVSSTMDSSVEEKIEENKVKESSREEGIGEKADEDKEPYPKLLVYQDWKQGMTLEDILKKYKKKVKKSSVSSWLSSWKHGKHLPKGAK